MSQHVLPPRVDTSSKLELTDELDLTLSSPIWDAGILPGILIAKPNANRILSYQQLYI